MTEAPPADPGPPLAILAVDDEPGVLALVRRCLNDRRFALIEASSGRRALEQLRAGPPIDLLITDLHMPSMAGEELAGHVRVLQPGVPVLYLTSHADRLFEVRASLGSAEAFLEKPFTRAGLREAVAQLLHGGTVL